MTPTTIKIDDVEYVRKDELHQEAEKMDDMHYVIVRTYSAGVFAGYLEAKTGQEVVLRKARRLYTWEGAASLSEMAQRGTSKPNSCKFPCAVDRVELLQAIEILSVTAEAKASIDKIPVWSC